MRSPFPGVPFASLLIVLLGPPILFGASPARAALPSAVASKVEPGLLRSLDAAPDDTLSAWIEFSDKGEESPADLARRLADAGQALSPKTRARRLRAHAAAVDYLDLPVEPSYLEALRARGLVPYGASRWFNRVAVRAPARRVVDVANLPFVTHVAPVEVMRRSGDPDIAPRPAPARPTRSAGAAIIGYGLTHDPIAQLNLAAVHDSGYTGAGILVCVLDEGFNFFDKHEALRDHVIPASHQRDFYRGLNTAQDTLDPTMVHGTWVLGLLAGRKFGTYVGAAYDADYALGRTEVRVFERQVEMVYWGQGAEWADSLGADVISTSLGYTTFDAPDPSYTYASMNGHTTIVTRAAEIAASKGILVVAAVGNDGGNSWHFLSAPSDGNGDSVLAVGAVDGFGGPAAFSSYGPSYDGRIKPDLAARGTQVATPGTSGAPDLYAYRDGTSFATPLVAGVAACLLQARPSWSARDVARALRASASRKAAPDDRVGYGIPNAFAALSETTTVPPPSGSPGLSLRSAGANPVVFEHGAAQFTLGIPASLCGVRTVVEVRDAQGRKVRGLWSGVVSCPALSLTWNGTDDEGRAVPAGLYLVDARVGGERLTLRLVGLH
jgi:subtilisin family serine protease